MQELFMLSFTFLLYIIRKKLENVKKIITPIRPIPTIKMNIKRLAADDPKPKILPKNTADDPKPKIAAKEIATLNKTMKKFLSQNFFAYLKDDLTGFLPFMDSIDIPIKAENKKDIAIKQINAKKTNQEVIVIVLFKE